MDAYIHLAHYLINIAASGLSLFFSAQVFFKHHYAKKALHLAPSMILYVGYVFILCILLLVNYIYLIAFWRPNAVIYDGRIMLIIGGIPSQLLIMHPLVEMSLCIDRCITVAFPLKYTSRKKQIFGIISATVILCANIGVFFQSTIIRNLPAIPETNCRMFYCIGNVFSIQYTLLIKTAMAVFCILFSGLLYGLIKFGTFDYCKTKKRANANIIYMTISTTVIDFLPNLLGHLCLLIFQKQIYEIIGPYSLTLAAVNVTVCMGLCFQVVTKTFQNKNVVAIAPTKFHDNPQQSNLQHE